MQHMSLKPAAFKGANQPQARADTSHGQYYPQGRSSTQSRRPAQVQATANVHMSSSPPPLINPSSWISCNPADQDQRLCVFPGGCMRLRQPINCSDPICYGGRRHCKTHCLVLRAKRKEEIDQSRCHHIMSRWRDGTVRGRCTNDSINCSSCAPSQSHCEKHLCG